MAFELSKSSRCLNASGIVLEKIYIIESSSFRGDVDTVPVGGTIDVS